MKTEDMVSAMGALFDEVRQNVTGGFICYLIDGRRFASETFRGAIEAAFNAHETKNS